MKNNGKLWTSLETSQAIYHSKSLDKNYPNIYIFIKFEQLLKIIIIKEIFSSFYHHHSPNISKSRNSRCQFGNFVAFT